MAIKRNFGSKGSIQIELGRQDKSEGKTEPLDKWNNFFTYMQNIEIEIHLQRWEDILGKSAGIHYNLYGIVSVFMASQSWGKLETPRSIFPARVLFPT